MAKHEKACPEAHPGQSHSDWDAARLAAEGTDLVKPGKPAATVGGHIRHHMRGLGMPQKQAVAVALDEQRRGEIEKNSPGTPHGNIASGETGDASGQGGGTFGKAADDERAPQPPPVQAPPKDPGQATVKPAPVVKATIDPLDLVKGGAPWHAYQERVAKAAVDPSASWVPVPGDEHGGEQRFFDGEWCYRWPSAAKARAAGDAWERKAGEAALESAKQDEKGTPFDKRPGGQDSWRLTRMAKDARKFAEVYASKARLDENDLVKADSAKPPAGFSPVPGGQHGGYRKQVGGKYEYWYPTAAAGHRAMMYHRGEAEKHEQSAGSWKRVARTTRADPKIAREAGEKQTELARTHREHEAGSSAFTLGEVLKPTKPAESGIRRELGLEGAVKRTHPLETHPGSGALDPKKIQAHSDPKVRALGKTLERHEAGYRQGEAKASSTYTAAYKDLMERVSGAKKALADPLDLVKGVSAPAGSPVEMGSVRYTPLAHVEPSSVDRRLGLAMPVAAPRTPQERSALSEPALTRVGPQGTLLRPDSGLVRKAGPAGPGSRGGKIIGHTSSGTPVYESHIAHAKRYRQAVAAVNESTATPLPSSYAARDAAVARHRKLGEELRDAESKMGGKHVSDREEMAAIVERHSAKTKKAEVDPLDLVKAG